MGQVIRFSEFDRYFENLENNGIVDGAILDANVIITLSCIGKKFHDSVSNFITNKITKRGISLYSTLNTRQEYLEFHRRLLMTEGLKAAVGPQSKINIPKEKKKLIEKQLDSLKKSEKRDIVFLYDREIKNLRTEFCSMGKIGWKSWKSLCKIYLREQLKSELQAFKKLNVNYISQHREDGKEFFHQNPTWENAVNICSDMGVGFADSMILNALQATTFPFVITLDADMAFAVLENDELKDIVIPDGIVENNMGLKKHE